MKTKTKELKFDLTTMNMTVRPNGIGYVCGQHSFKPEYIITPKNEDGKMVYYCDGEKLKKTDKLIQMYAETIMYSPIRAVSQKFKTTTDKVGYRIVEAFNEWDTSIFEDYEGWQKCYQIRIKSAGPVYEYIPIDSLTGKIKERNRIIKILHRNNYPVKLIKALTGLKNRRNIYEICHDVKRLSMFKTSKSLNKLVE